VKSNGVVAEFADPIQGCRALATARLALHVSLKDNCRTLALLQTPSDDRNRRETRAIAPLMRSSTARFDWVPHVFDALRYTLLAYQAN
jgi:hypothetical protein